ncbi:type II secretion system protein N [Pseudomonas sp. R5(2019)]|uniref:type II secretion system protein N n=1 Tax=Pseudomonas sp. R5(2019) TaxID=2697566 RepID=UPI001411F241|nr:type II secretion system protein N [Pseudomonas sp. R5(2019)]NBA96205.1 hypothetical protein [Pseudomonas sp. R5(2019)]
MSLPVWLWRLSSPRWGMAAVLVLLGFGVVWLSIDLWQLNRTLRTPALIAPQAVAPLPPAAALEAGPIAALFGAQVPGQSQDRQAVPLTLLASLVETRLEHSRALIQAPATTRFYRPGESLPGGALLKHIASSHVVILRNGREQALNLKPARTGLLNPVPSGNPTPAAVSPTSRTSP